MRHLGFLLRLAVSTAPGLLTAFLLYNVVAGLQYPVRGYAMKLIVDGITEHRHGQVVGAATVGALLVGGFYGLQRWGVFRLGEQLGARVGHALDLEVTRRMGELPGLDQHERPAVATELGALTMGLQQLSGMPQLAAVLLQLGIGAVSAVAVAAHLDSWLLLLPLAALPDLYFASRAGAWSRKAYDEYAEAERLRAGLLRLVRTPGFAKELRLLDAGDELRRRTQQAGQRYLASTQRLQAKVLVGTVVGNLVSSGAYLAAVVLVARHAVAGTATAGDVVLVLAIGRQVIGILTSFGNILGAAGQLVVLGRSWAWLQTYTAEQHWPGGCPAPQTLADGIRLDRVRFCYPGSSNPVLDDLSLRLPAGSVVALVGDNGAGKSTLVKLLCGFYRPDDGVIRIDGTPLPELELGHWREQVTASFQDHAHIQLVARESIGIGDVTRLGQVAAVDTALDRAGTPALVAALPQGLDTQLGTQFDGGVELSGGQWQQVAMARGMMRDAPLLVIFDEPTAALDPDAEHRLFSSVHQRGRELGATFGTVTVLVSHRLATVSAVDLIVVLEQGRVLESGSHRELMALGGRYAELYQLQARGYR